MYLLLIFLFSCSLFAQSPTKSPFEEVVENAGKVPETLPDSKPQKIRSKNLRDDSIGSAMVGYQLLTSWVPSKKVLAYEHHFNQKWSLEFEYAWSKLDSPLIGVDIGSIRERRFTLLGKRYFGNSFHIQLGPYLNDFEAGVGSDILDNLGAGARSSFGVEGLGLALGMGNQWQWQNGLSLGLDWLRLNVPVKETKVESRVLADVTNRKDAKEIKDAIRKFNYIPTFVILGIKLGYTF
jgi:hypothetical protein